MRAEFAVEPGFRLGVGRLALELTGVFRPPSLVHPAVGVVEGDLESGQAQIKVHQQPVEFHQLVPFERFVTPMPLHSV